jgi:hypothetical protein
MRLQAMENFKLTFNSKALNLILRKKEKIFDKN